MFDAAGIISEAEATVGITDDEAFVRRNLEHLVDALHAESAMSPEGFASARRALLADTANRLEGLKWLREYPAIAAEPIAEPVLLMGLPRSGTTYFQYLFDCDPRFRLIRTWEALTPSPPPGVDPAAAEERRRTWAQRRRQMRPQVEGFDALHLYDEDGSEECHAFLEQSFGAAGLNNLYRVPSYFDYLLDEADLEASYRVHRRQLQLLQWRTPRRPWALKYPNHVLAIPEILRVYPDARLVMTHRDPLQTLASIARMSCALRSTRCDQPVDPHDVGEHMTHFLQRHIERIMAAADSPQGDRIIHVDYYALLHDPVSELVRVHAGLGIESPPEVTQSVAQWCRANPKNARGKNEYTLDQYGLDEGNLLERFGDYMQRFSIPRERDGLARTLKGS